MKLLLNIIILVFAASAETEQKVLFKNLRVIDFYQYQN